MTKHLRGIVALLIRNGINDLVGQAQGNEHPNNCSSVGSCILCTMPKHLGNGKVPWITGSLARSLVLPTLCPLNLGGTRGHMGCFLEHIHILWGSSCVIGCTSMAFVLILKVLVFTWGTFTLPSLSFLSLLWSSIYLSFPLFSYGWISSAPLGVLWLLVG